MIRRLRSIRPTDVLLGALQVAPIAANTVFLSSDSVAASLVTSYLISYIWTHNVRRVAVTDEFGRHVYSASAMVGGFAGWAFARWLQTVV